MSQTFSRRWRVLVQARVVRVRLALVPGTAALVPRLMAELVVHVNRIDSVTRRIVLSRAALTPILWKG